MNEDDSKTAHAARDATDDEYEFIHCGDGPIYWVTPLARIDADGAWSAYLERWQSRNERLWHDVSRGEDEWWKAARRVNRLARWAMRRDGVLTRARKRSLRRLDENAKGERLALGMPAPWGEDP